ncbi:MAG TPA: Calx-beta domain-containing protein [Candidatus Paceibacterota bacterium]|nr:Calx-beta domain-containing protein [Candidatus Paceibacterota bacterium]HRZ56768.1 Calx-beta domain-containing protein [Candidatus Paceibacterota bacterium]
MKEQTATQGAGTQPHTFAASERVASVRRALMMAMVVALVLTSANNRAGEPTVPNVDFCCQECAPGQVGEWDGHALIPLSLDRATDSPVTIDYFTRSQTAQANEDYLEQSGTLRFDPGQLCAAVRIPIRQDEEAEGPETFAVVFVNAIGASLPSDPSVTITIEDRTGTWDPSWPGFLDTDFHPWPLSSETGDVFAVAATADGAVWLGGWKLLKFLPDGTLQADAEPRYTVELGPVWCLLSDADGGLFLGGEFQKVSGSPRAGLARLRPEGHLDEDFTPPQPSDRTKGLPVTDRAGLHQNEVCVAR